MQEKGSGKMDRPSSSLFKKEAGKKRGRKGEVRRLARIEIFLKPVGEKRGRKKRTRAECVGPGSKT